MWNKTYHAVKLMKDANGINILRMVPRKLCRGRKAKSDGLFVVQSHNRSVYINTVPSLSAIRLVRVRVCCVMPTLTFDYILSKADCCHRLACGCTMIGLLTVV